MEIMVECPDCSNLVFVDFDESAKTEWADCPKCGSKWPASVAIACYHEGKQRESSDFVVTAGVLKEYRGRSCQVHLPASVTVIGMRCFEDNQDIVELYATTNLRVIGEYAFSDCTQLRRVALPEGLVEIGHGAFDGCDSLEEVVIPITCSCILEGAFRNCKNLKRVRFICHPSEYRARSVWLGYGCRDNGLARVDAWGAYCPDAPERTKCFNLPDGLFEGCSSLLEVNIPSCVAKIGCRCFAGCESLRSVDLSVNDEIFEIGESAFYGCKSLSSIDLGKSESLRSIDDEAFRDCFALKRVDLPTRLQRKSFETGRLYEELGLCVGGGVFAGCERLEHINIPDFVRFFFRFSSQDPFDGCTRLQVDISREKMLKDCQYFRGSGPDGKGLSERCFNASAVKYNRLQKVKADLLDTRAELANCRERLRNASLFDFELKSELKRRISELEQQRITLWNEGDALDSEAEREVRKLCNEYDINFGERFCRRKGDGLFGALEWESFSDWCRRAYWRFETP